LPTTRGGLLTTKQEECPFTFSDSPAYLRRQKELEDSKRAALLESKDETRGFMRSVEELGRKQQWDQALQVLERKTSVPSGLFLVVRAVLRWRFGRYAGALQDAEEALRNYGSSSQAGPLAAAFLAIARTCARSEARDRGSCSKDMKVLVAAWEQAELKVLDSHSLGQGLFHPRAAERLPEPQEVVEGMEARDCSYVAASGVRVGYTLLLNRRDQHAPLVVHFHGSGETAADYRSGALAQRYRDLPVHLLVVDYRGYGWSAGQPSLATLLKDAEPLAEKLPEILVQASLPWPYPGGLLLSGRSLGAQVAVHLAALYPKLFRALALDSALATSATGDRLGRAPERAAALACWRKELADANLEILQPTDTDFWCLSVLEKIKAYDGELLVMHGLADEVVPYDGSESLHAACSSRQKELVLIEGVGHNNIGSADEYWSALKRLSLKVQLDDQLPSVGPTVEHLCAVCAEKASSKCGRCLKVWYCGRAHQAEHWKAHKLTCAGGPPEPKPKVQPEGEACVVAVLTPVIDLRVEATQLATALQALGAQEQAPQAIRVSWYAASEELIETVRRVLDEARAAHPTVPIRDQQWAAQGRPQQFALLHAVVPAVVSEEPGHAWVMFPDPAQFWSPRAVALVLPVIRRAAPDARVVAISCSRMARPRGQEKLRLTEAVQVDAALSSGAAALCESEQAGLADLVVRTRWLQSFMDATPEAVLSVSHELCLHRFTHRLRHTFGKKVQDFVPPDGEWMRWSAGKPAEGCGAEAASQALAGGDHELGVRLLEGLRPLGQGSEEPEGVEAGGRPKAPFADAGEAGAAVSALRRQIEKAVVLHAGEKLAERDLRSLAMEHVGAFLADRGLRELSGIHRWAKSAAAELSRRAAELLEVEVVAAQAE
ncbi:unnamed protein product, partial [Prorocentrum cordatum]